MDAIDPHEIATAPEWAMLVGDLGRFLVLFAVACFALGAVGWAFSGANAGIRRRAGYGFIAVLAGYVALAFDAVAKDFFYSVPFAVLGLALAFLIAFEGWLALTQESLRERIPAKFFVYGGYALLGTFVCLGALFIGNQFEYAYIWPRASIATELKYKIAGIWSGQEGSFLLWACASAVFGMLGARAAGPYRRWFTVAYAIFLLGLTAILAYESPFHVDPDAWTKVRELHANGLLASVSLPWLPPDGLGMTPSLQNYWVVIHPPTIFSGFGALTLLFCWAISAMITGNAKDWASMVRPWSLLTVAILGLGLCMGGFWAYETLGWGGFWAWDPVENVSFVPWCFVAALVHGLIVQVTRGRWITTNLLFAGLPFILFVYGTFMTRSGFLDQSSVHSFAEMNRTALWLLIGVLGIGVVAFFGLWLTRGLSLGREIKHSETEGVHREGTYRSSTLLLAAIGCATAAGMSVPLVQSLSGGTPKAVVEQSYHLILSWFFVPLMLLLAAGPFISWRGMPFRALASRLLNIFSVSLGLVGILMFLAKRSDWAGLNDPKAKVLFPFGIQVPQFPWMLFLIWLCAFACLANLWRIIEMWKRSKASVGGFVAHIGVAALMAGLIISRGFEQKSQVIFVRQDMAASALGFTVQYQGKTNESDRHDRNNLLLFKLTGANESFQAQAGQYYVPPRAEGEEESQVNWPYIHHTLWHDIYFTTKELETEGPPIQLAIGDSKVVNNVLFRYDRFEMIGPPGKPGTKFVTHLTATDEHGGRREVAPYVEITKEGPVQGPMPLDDVLSVITLAVRPGTHEAIFQLRYLPTAYGIQMFYKPMTILVWTGAGILAFGGFLAAWYRRRPGTSSAPIAQAAPADVEREKNAPATVA